MIFYKRNGLLISEETKPCLSNTWLNSLAIKKIPVRDYVLFSPSASTSVRIIPHIFHYDIVDMLYKKFYMLIFGFSDIDHPHYMNISKYSSQEIDFVSIIRFAQHVYTCDSSALHISAGFNIPTTCIFSAIDQKLRVKYYKNCDFYFIGDDRLFQIQNSEDEELLKLVEEIFRNYFYYTAS
ncbi:hypothetical protein [Klebsiella sp. BIGb0407]|uniref:hypothetical protein n=1 Tax=Klebsiella sp. BIGb0407 TaxID=2940603 RepID=UPI00216A7359|nr:hypothetical protein [Klebsiella sp. BIGb0407]MCS3430768.1 ADP-heptose:LPS heptosyltransferase [Klebsiella sp. BIGb0407]